MNTFILAVHIMVCLALIGVVLLQRGKGADMGAALGGGGSNTVFGSRGAGNFLTKLTSACAVVFMVTSLSLSYLGARDPEELIFDDEPAPLEAPLEEVTESTEDASAGVLEEVLPPVPLEESGDAPTEP